jgi:outer membrane receptor protein involved in Fe transport
MRFLRTIFSISTVLSIQNAFSQSGSYNITGIVNTSNNKSPEFGNAIVLNEKDSSLIKGTPFENGNFTIVGIAKDSVLIKISSIGFKDHLQRFYRSGNDSMYFLNVVTLIEDNTLNEVTVSAKKPFFEMDGEKVKVNVEGTSLTAAGTALDVLRRSPSVMVNNQDVVSVFGKGAAIIYLDGLLLPSVDILKSLPSSDIKSIEIIANPSAKYDAAGRVVINIITIRNNLEGYNVNLIQNTLYGKYLFSYSGLRFNYTKKKWSANISYGKSSGKQWNSDEYKRKYDVNDSTHIEMNNSIYETQKFLNTNYYRAGLNYRIDSTSLFGIQYNGFYEAKTGSADNQNDIRQNDIQQYILKTTTTHNPFQINNSANINYSKKFDTLGTELFSAVQYGNFVSKSVSNIGQNTSYGSFVSDQDKRNSNRNDIKIFSAQIDLTNAFNKKWKLESGLKNSYIGKTSDVKFENLSNGEWISDPNYLNGFEFSENIAAAYSELRYKAKKLNMRFGGRAEMTKSDGFSKTLNKPIIDRKYINFFPSGFFGYDFTKDLTTSLTLSSRIHRPTFQDLDPFINYIDSLSSLRGNPYLLPEYTNSIEASLIYMKEANITFGYNNTKGAMTLVVEKVNDSTQAFTGITKNIDRSESYSAGITIPYELEWWTTANYFGYFLNTFSYVQNGVKITNHKPTFSIYLYDEFRFKKLFSLEINYEYTSAAVDGIFMSKPFAMLNANLKKTFFKDQLTVRLLANDVLSQYIMRGQSNIPLYTVEYRSRYNTHNYMLAINYKFGRLKNSNYKNRSVSEDEYSRIKMEK